MASRSQSPRRDPQRGRAQASTIGDLMSGFALDSGRRHTRVDRTAPEPADFPPYPAGRGVVADIEDVDDDVPGPAAVRPYAWTKGRTTSSIRFEIETLLSTTAAYTDSDESISSEYHTVAALCHQARSIAEVAALLAIPLGVAKVLAGDMAGAGLLAVHETASVDGEAPDVVLMERILSGLRKL